MKKKLLCVSMCVAMAATALVGCGSKDKDDDTTKAPAETNEDSTGGEDATGGEEVAKGRIYYLNFKPEAEAAWNKVAEAYKAETGVEVKIVTAASGTYESTLKSEMGKKEAPTLFQINGPVGYQTWKDYCADLSGSDLYSWVSDKSMCVTDGDGVYGIPYAVESYGIIYNKTIMEKYFALEGKADTGCSSVDDINTFAKLKAVADDMQAHKDDLGIKGAFTSAGMDSSSDWRFKTHLLNVAISTEFADKGVDDLDEIDFTYAENFKNLWDLYVTDSTCEASLLGQKTGQDAASEFALGEAAMYQNGVWAWGGDGGISTSGGTIKEDEVGYLPLYMGLKDEEKQGLCTGTENFMCINSKASEEDQKATLAFVEWVFSSDKGKEFVCNDLGFLTLFTTFGADETPADPLMKAAAAYASNAELKAVPWTGMNHFPSEEFKNVVGADMLAYAQGSLEWDKLVENAKKSWADEKAIAK